MNTPISRSPAPPSRESRDDREPRTQGSEYRQAEAAFERLLRAKTATREGDDERDGASADAPPCSVPQQPAASADGNAATREVALPRADAPAANEASSLGLRASVEAAFGAPIPPASAACDAHTWEVSLGEPLGVPMDLRATRSPQQVTGAAAAGWSLTLSSSARDAALLARHVPRLHERLRSRGLDHGPVALERDDEETP
jgi:hypothetical protein